MGEIRYKERETQKIEKEKIYGRWALSLLYGRTFLARIVAFLCLPLLARFPIFSHFYGLLQKRPQSRKKIVPFIQTFRVDASEFAQSIESFSSFNDFFIRKLKPEARPVEPDPRIAILPADARYLVFPRLDQVDHFYVKGKSFHLFSFLQDPVLARRFAYGSMVLARLCPSDYHRFHFCCTGRAEKAQLVSGTLYSVNPLALRRRFSILSENKRMITEFDTDSFGTIIYVEIGATCVGTIHQTYRPGALVDKGDEKGFFSFGGSCLALLFEEGRIKFDADLIQTSKEMLETRGKFGQTLGRSTSRF